MRQVATSPSTAAWQFLFVLLMGVMLAFVIASMPPLIIIGAVAAAMLGFAFLQRPDLGLLLLLVARVSTDATLSTFAALAGERGGVRGLLLNPNTTLILIVIVAGGIYLLGRGLPFISLPAGRPYALLTLVGLVGVLRAERLLSSLSEWLPVVASLIVYALAANLFRDERRTQMAIDALAVSFIPPAALGFYQLLTSQGRLLAPGVIRIDGTFVHPNPFAIYLVVIISIFLCQMLFQRGWRRWLSLAVLLSASFLLIATYTRVAWIGALVVFAVIGVLQERRLLLLGPLLAGAAYVALPTIGSRLADPLGGSFADRVRIWNLLIDRWIRTTGESQAFVPALLDRLTGLGPGSFGPLIVVMPHNDYLRVLAEYGVFGLLLFVTVYITMILMAYRAWRRSQGIKAAVALGFLGVALAYSVMSLTDNLFAMTVNQVTFWTLAGLTAGIVHSEWASETVTFRRERSARLAS